MSFAFDEAPSRFDPQSRIDESRTTEKNSFHQKRTYEKSIEK